MTVVDLLGGTYDAGGINKSLVGLVGYGVTAANVVHSRREVKGMGVSCGLGANRSYTDSGACISKVLADGENILYRLLVCKIADEHTVGRVSAAVKKN